MNKQLESIGQSPFARRGEYMHHHVRSLPTIPKLPLIKNNSTQMNSGQAIMKAWDFFSDPYSVPARHKFQNEKTTKRLNNSHDSLDQLMDGAISETTIRKPKNVQFHSFVHVKTIHGEEVTEPTMLNSKAFTRKSKFSRYHRQLKQLTELQ